MKNIDYEALRKKFIKLLLFIVVACGSGLLCRCVEEPDLPEKIFINLALGSSDRENRRSDEFYVNEEIDIRINAVHKEPIDTLAFDAIIGPEENLTVSEINSVRGIVRSHNEIDTCNLFTQKFDTPGEVLLIGVALSETDNDFDTLRITIVEEPGQNNAPVIENFHPVRRYAAPDLPCSLSVRITDTQRWQRQFLEVLNSDGTVSLFGDSLVIWTPSENDTPGMRECSVTVTDNGNPPMSDTASFLMAILDNGKLPPPRNVRVIERTDKSVTLKWDEDSIPDRYRIYRHTTPSIDSATEFSERTSASLVDSTDTVFFYFIKAVSIVNNTIITSNASNIVIGRDTVNSGHAIEFSDLEKVISEDSTDYTFGLRTSKAAEKTITIWFSVASKSDGLIDFTLQNSIASIAQGDTSVLVTLSLGDLEVSETPETLLIQIDSVSSGYIDGNSIHRIIVADNDTYYSIDYNGNDNNGGSVPVDSGKYTAGTLVKVLWNTGNLVKTGYTFKGWNSIPDGGGASYENGSSVRITNNNITLYAKWTINQYTVTFNSQGGGQVVSKKVTHGNVLSQPTAPSAPLKTKCTFGGWYKESDCINKWDFANNKVTASLTLYAQWKLSDITNGIIANIQGPAEAIGAYNLVGNARVSYDKDNSLKDLLDLSLAGKGFSGKFGSGNKTTFATSTTANYTNATNVSIKKLASSASAQQIAVNKVGTVFVAKLAGGNRGYAIVKITSYDPNAGSWSGNKGIAKFSYKFTPN